MRRNVYLGRIRVQVPSNPPKTWGAICTWDLGGCTWVAVRCQSTQNMRRNMSLRPGGLQVPSTPPKTWGATCTWDPEVYLRTEELQIPCNPPKTWGATCTWEPEMYLRPGGLQEPFNPPKTWGATWIWDPDWWLLTYWKVVVVGVCELWSVAEPSQNKKRKARPDKTEGENDV